MNNQMRIARRLSLRDFFFILTIGMLCLFGASASYAQDSAMQPGSDMDYRLGSGDKVKITVFGETDLSGEYVVDGSGNVRLPLIGQVRAMGLSLRDFEGLIIQQLQQGYLRDPKVSAEVTNYRPFYIIGEVNKPGEYPYVNYMSVINAVALAGGYTYRANDSNVYVRRNGESKEEYVPADATTKIHPGDIIRVPERFF